MADKRLTRSLGTAFRLPSRRYRGVARWLDDTTGGGGVIKDELRHIFPDNWTFFFGEVALYSFIILVVTGVYLCLFFRASAAPAVYTGSFKPLDGVSMSEAYKSVLQISFDVRAGLVIRQVHHWAALVFIAALVMHMFRMLFTGAYRRPRRWNFVIGLTLIQLAIINGVFGYSLPDDLLSGTGLRIAYSITQSVPIIGPNLASLLFGGDFPSSALIPRVYPVHILLVPGAIAGLLGLHLGLLWFQRHTRYPSRRHNDMTIVGTPLVPAYALRTTGFFLLIAGLLTAFGALFQINPVWLYGPYEPWNSTTMAQPDWYTGWLEGSVRLFPPWDIHIGSFAVPALFWPSAVLPGVLFTILLVTPWGDALVAGDNEFHNVLETPRDRPGRTALVAALVTFLGMLLLAGGDDVFAVLFNWSVATMVDVLRFLTFGVPILVGLLVYVIFRRRQVAAAEAE
jgi:quinol---cytochrome-c reductase cytochrome b subunit